MRDRTDEELLKLAGHDEAAFMMLFARHREVVFRVAYRLTDSATAAEDITQECFLGLLSAGGRFDPAKGSLRSYLYGTVRNHARRYHGLHGVEDEIDDTEIDDAAEPAQAFLQLEQAQVIRQAVSALPVAQREALVLFQYEELPLEEIAVILGIDAGTVKSRLHRARVRLRRTLTPYFRQGSNAR